MARPPFPLPHALHPDLVILDEFGRALLPRPDRVHYREELCLDPRPRRRHHRFPGRAQRRSAALRVEGEGRGDPAQDQRRQTGTCRRGTKVTLFQRQYTSTFLAATVAFIKPIGSLMPATPLVPRTAIALMFFDPITAPTPERPAARCRALMTAA